MKKLWADFKSFAMGGNMLDLALGFIIGAAFAGLVESLAKNVIMQLVAAVFGTPDFSSLTVGVNGTQIQYGAFLTDLVGFVLIAAVLFLLVLLIKRAGMGNFRAQGSRECPYCKSFIAIDAIKCQFCTADVDPEVIDEDTLPLLELRPGWQRPEGV